MTEWNIQSRAHACEMCGKKFADKEGYHTVLFDERTQLRRSDLCGGCWEQNYAEGARERKGFVSYWQGVYEAPVAPAEPIQKENAESLLRKIIELNDPAYVPAAYILAVMLERKRLLKVKEQLQRDGHRLFVYEHAKSGDVFTVLEPKLQLNQLDSVQRDVGHLLEHGLNPVTPQAEAATASGPADQNGPVAPDAGADPKP